MSKNDPKVKQESASPANPEPKVEVDKPKVLSDEELQSLKGELEPGESGWLPIDKFGNPTGLAVRERPDDGLYVAVHIPRPDPSKEMTTSSGAPVMEGMNPNPNLRANYKDYREDSGKSKEH